MFFPVDNDVANYLQRLQIDTSLLSDPAALVKQVHLCHSFTVPFENLSIILGGTPSLRYEDLFQKIVHNRRGGYCYELNGLLYCILKKLSLPVSILSARILFGAQGTFARGHKLLLVQPGEERWLVDVGYRNGIISPLPLHAEATQQHSETFRLRQTGGLFLLQKKIKTDWTDLYSFTLDEQLPVDFEPHNFYNSNSPDSVFTRMRIVSLKTTQGSVSLLNNVLVELKMGERTETLVTSKEQYDHLLQTVFGIVLTEEEVARLYGHGTST